MAKRQAVRKRIGKAKPKASARGKAPSHRPRKPRDTSLPGMEEHAIKELEDVASTYADIRDQRIELNKQEVVLKTTTLRLMKKHGKTIYRHAGVVIQIVPGEEDVKVRVPKVKEDAEESQAVAETAETTSAAPVVGEDVPF